jgi:hypothetical protein
MLARQGLVQPTGTGELTAWAFDAESWVTYACSPLERVERLVHPSLRGRFDCVFSLPTHELARLMKARLRSVIDRVTWPLPLTSSQ